MKKWEDIVRDRMEEFDGTLPETAFDEFRARRNGSEPASAAKRFPLVWAILPAVAAGLAAVLFLRQPGVPDDAVQLIEKPVTTVAEAAEPEFDSVELKNADIASVESVAPAKATSLVAPAPMPDDIGNAAQPTEQETVDIYEPENVLAASQAEEPAETENATEVTLDPAVPSPYVTEKADRKPIKINVAPTAGVLAGGGLIASIASSILGAGNKMDTTPAGFYYTSGNGPTSGSGLTSGSGQGNSATSSTGFTDSAGTGNTSGFLEQENVLFSTKHCMPLRLTLSTRVPVGDRLSLTTGLGFSSYHSTFTYTLYHSTFTYTLSGDMKQRADYLDIPVRLDWTLASNRWLEAFVGSGIEGDYCLGASFDGRSIDKDGMLFSLLGAGGLQFNLSKNTGLYVEPTLSWIIPSKGQVLKTYRTEHPLMFSLSTGLRITFGK